MSIVRVVEKENKLAVHCITWNIERAHKWIKETGSFYFPGKVFAIQVLKDKEWKDVED